MKKIVKKVLAAFLVLALAFSAVQTAPVVRTQAATKNYMKNLKGLKWDLKNGKTVKNTFKYFDGKKKNISWTMKNLKIADAKKNGYKQLTCTLNYKVNWKPSKAEIDKYDVYDDLQSTCWYTVVDFNTGLSLEGENDANVTVSSDVDTVNEKKFTGNKVSFTLPIKITVKLKITYPKDYNGLCIGVGGTNQLVLSSEDNNFFDGRGPFGKTSFYKKGKANSHWLRVADVKTAEKKDFPE